MRQKAHPPAWVAKRQAEGHQRDLLGYRAARLRVAGVAVGREALRSYSTGRFRRSRRMDVSSPGSTLTEGAQGGKGGARCRRQGRRTLWPSGASKRARPPTPSKRSARNISSVRVTSCAQPIIAAPRSSGLIYPALGSRQIDTIKRSEIVRFLDKIEDERGPQMAHAALGVFSPSCSIGTPAGDDDFLTPIRRGMGARQDEGDCPRTGSSPITSYA